MLMRATHCIIASLCGPLHKLHSLSPPLLHPSLLAGACSGNKGKKDDARRTSQTFSAPRDVLMDGKLSWSPRKTVLKWSFPLQMIANGTKRPQVHHAFQSFITGGEEDIKGQEREGADYVVLPAAGSEQLLIGNRIGHPSTRSRCADASS